MGKKGRKKNSGAPAEYKLRLTIVVDDAKQQALIDAARQCYLDSGVRSSSDVSETPMPAEAFIDSVEAALMVLIENQPAFAQDGVEVESMSCTSEDMLAGAENSHENHEDVATDELGDPDELDEYETGVYLCRWPNGDFSIVKAESKRNAIIALDEWGAAHPSQVLPIDNFMADFSLNDRGEMELNEFGEDFRDVILDACYPVLREVLNQQDVADEERVRAAVIEERTRLLHNQPADEAKTEKGKQIARELGTSAVVADYYVDRAGKKILNSRAGEKGKVKKPN